MQSELNGKFIANINGLFSAGNNWKCFDEYFFLKHLAYRILIVPCTPWTIILDSKCTQLAGTYSIYAGLICNVSTHQQF